MGACESRPPLKPNPYAPREYSEALLQQIPKTQLAKPSMYLQDSFSKRQGDEITKPNSEDKDKSLGLSKKFESMFEVVEEVGRGCFTRTTTAIAKRAGLKGQKVAVKIIPKYEMTTATTAEGIRREVNILRALKGRPNVVQLHDAFEDDENVYMVMELCEGGKLTDKLLSRGGKFSEDEAKAAIVQMLNVVACLHLHGVVHRDIIPEVVTLHFWSALATRLVRCTTLLLFMMRNFQFVSKDENSQLKAIDFGSSALVKPDQKLDDIVGKKYYMAPEVFHRSYSTEADLWSIGVTTYVLLCGNVPFWARTDSETTYREVQRASLCLDEDPWPSLSSESKDFVERLLNENPRKRLSAAQALCHPWIRNHKPIKLPIDILTFRLMMAYTQSSSLRKAALRALSKTLSADELYYLQEQFALMHPDESGGITSETIKKALIENRADAITKSNINDLLDPLKALQFRKMYLEEFCAAAISSHQLDTNAHRAFEIFEKEGNRVIIIKELTSELKLSPTVSVRAVVQEWIRHTDGKLSYHGFLKLLLG